MSDDLSVVMEIPPDVAFSRLLTTAAEAMALRGGIGQRENLRFQLTVEELFACLCGTAQGGRPIRLVLTGKRHLLRAAFSFAATSLSLGALNAAGAAVRPALSSFSEDEPSRDLGLLLAGKAANRFRLELQGEDRVLLEAEVDKAYPAAPAVRPSVGLRPPYSVAICRDSAPLSQAAALALAAYPAWLLPPSFRTPGKFADMVEDGQIDCAVAFDASGRTAGLLGWSARGDKALVFCGPYVFSPRDEAKEVARLLVDAFLEAVARNKYSIVLGFQATDDLPEGYFEPLGSLGGRRDGQDRLQPVLFRHLREDAGMAVWSAPRLEDFLRQAYDRLALPRDVLPVEPRTGRGRRESLLGCDVDLDGGLAELRPFLDGEDMAENLAAHARVLRDKGIDDVLFHMDLARPWEAALADDLIRAGFSPKVVFPHGGRGDVVVWRHGRAD